AVRFPKNRHVRLLQSLLVADLDLPALSAKAGGKFQLKRHVDSVAWLTREQEARDNIHDSTENRASCMRPMFQPGQIEDKLWAHHWPSTHICLPASNHPGPSHPLLAPARLPMPNSAFSNSL